MNVRSYLSIAAIVSAVALPGSSFAQEEHMIGGKTVPVDQVTEIQNKCNQLREENPAATPPVADAAAPADATPAPAGAAPAGEAAAPPADNAAAPANSANAQAPSGAGWMADGSKVDLEKLTVEMCDEGNFKAPAM